MNSRNPPDDDRDRRSEPGKGELQGIFQGRLNDRRKIFPGRGAGEPKSEPDRASQHASRDDAGPTPDEPVGPDFWTKISPTVNPMSHQASVRPGKTLVNSPVPDPGSRNELPRNDRPQPHARVSADSPRERQSEPGLSSGTTESRRDAGGPGDRRVSFRYAVTGIRVAIGWSASPSSPPPGHSCPPPTMGHGTTRRSKASSRRSRLLSSTSARPDSASSSASLPPSDRALWVGIKGGDPTAWSGVILRSLSEPRPGEFVLRLSFINTCPYDLFKYVVLQSMSFLDRNSCETAPAEWRAANERRRACRSRAVIHDVVLGWEKDGTSDELPGYLEDVSMDGCRARSPRVPPVRPGETIWFGLAGSQPAERIEGILVDARKPFLRECSIRIKFLTPLPYATFKYLVYGPQDFKPKEVDRRECETDQFWR